MCIKDAQSSVANLDRLMAIGLYEDEQTSSEHRDEAFIMWFRSGWM